jgi:formate dehydrogenase gamma subunit
MKGGTMDRHGRETEPVRRFSLYRIIEHWFSASVFLALVMSGLTQRFYGVGISQWIVMAVGGIDAMRLLHRVAGVLLLGTMAQHVLVAFCGVLSRRWRPLMMIEREDFFAAIQNLKYYLCMADRPASCDRYTYQQKFEYWGILSGSIIMAMTGVILWFPAFVTRFLPGEIIPAAKALHTNEAMLIVLLVALWHIYNALFSPEVFPMDTSIVTGYISRERMEREHPLELARSEETASEGLSHAGEEKERGEEAPEWRGGEV